MTLTLSIDPRSKQSGYTIFEYGFYVQGGVLPNHKILELLDKTYEIVLVEDYEARGGSLGHSGTQTMSFIAEIFYECGKRDLRVKKCRNSLIKTHHDGYPNSKPSKTIDSLIEKYPFYRRYSKAKNADDKIQIVSHEWSALALYYYWQETEGETKKRVHPKHPSLNKAPKKPKNSIPSKNDVKQTSKQTGKRVGNRGSDSDPW